jgi:hypothetical protein
MKFLVTEVRPTSRPTDGTMGLEPEFRQYPDGTLWQVLGEVQDDAGAKLGGCNFTTAAKGDYAIGVTYNLSLTE